MKTINFSKFPLLDRDGNVTETNIEKTFFDLAWKNSQSRDDAIRNQSFKYGEDIELTEENIEYFNKYLALIQPATYLYSFEKYVEQLNK